MIRARFLILTLLVASGCSGYRIVDVQVPTTRLTDYREVMIEGIDLDAFMENNPAWAPHRTNIQNGLNQVKVLAEGYLRRNFTVVHEVQPGTLVLVTELFIYKPGSRFLRWLIGFGSGTGTLGLRVNVEDGETGDVIAIAEVYGVVRNGFFGGSFGAAYKFAAIGLYRYTTTPRNQGV
ncbi:MAG: DUF4410 domain-containing protein [Planctomycetota bacterium]|nr:DUF4410 domain-containing protein [Planctomycetota bacterium]